MLPTFVTAHTFCASRGTRVRFKTIRRKQNEARASALAIPKENWDNHAFLRDNSTSS